MINYRSTFLASLDPIVPNEITNTGNVELNSLRERETCKTRFNIGLKRGSYDGAGSMGYELKGYVYRGPWLYGPDDKYANEHFRRGYVRGFALSILWILVEV